MSAIGAFRQFGGSFATVLWPGVLVSVAVAAAATLANPWLKAALGGRVGVPVVVIALVIGMALHPLAGRAVFEPGLTFCVKKLLRWAIALLGLRIALGDIVSLGLGTALLVIVAMAATVTTGFLLARLLGREPGMGALGGVATAVCGASAALATDETLGDPDQRRARRDCRRGGTCGGAERGRLAGAALDVFDSEPLAGPAAARLAGVPNLILTPHIGGVTEESNARVSKVTIENVLRVIA
ncbi:hypothetical protein BTHI11S_04284 [Bosea thiooxidans]